MAKLTIELACEMARKLPDVTEKEHFGRAAFWANKKIFMTVGREQDIVLKFSPEQQREFLSRDGEAFVEIGNKWGKQGWTRVEVAFADRSEFAEALKLAYQNMGKAKARKAK